jgi:hypothetical protein
MKISQLSKLADWSTLNIASAKALLPPHKCGGSHHLCRGLGRPRNLPRVLVGSFPRINAGAAATTYAEFLGGHAICPVCL